MVLKKYQVPGTVPSGKPPKSEPYRAVPCRTMQWKSAICGTAEVVWKQVSLIAAFSSSEFFGLFFLIFLVTIPHRFSMGFRSGEFAGQSSTPTPCSFNQLLVLLAVWAGAKSCWKMKSAYRCYHDTVILKWPTLFSARHFDLPYILM